MFLPGLQYLFQDCILICDVALGKLHQPGLLPVQVGNAVAPDTLLGIVARYKIRTLKNKVSGIIIRGEKQAERR